MMRLAIQKLSICLAATTVLAGSALGGTVRIVVQPSFRGEPLVLDSLRYRNAAGEALSVTRLSWFLSSIALRKADGEWLAMPDTIAWLDAAKRRTSFEISEAPEGAFTAIRFDVGMNEKANASDPASFPPDHPLNGNLNGLHWSWQGGYIFLAVEGLHRRGNELPGGYALHLAREPFRTQVMVETPITVSQHTTVPLSLDVAGLLDAVQPISFEKNGATTHSKDGDPLALALAANLKKAFKPLASPQGETQAAITEKPRPLHMPKVFTPYRFSMGAKFPLPGLPLDNPLIEERAALGEALFREPALSRDGSISCSSCHLSHRAFSDPSRFSFGVERRIGTRNAMPIFNLAWKSEFFWDGRAPSLRAQALMPIQDHLEMDESLGRVIAKLGESPGYAKAFERAFGSGEITGEKIGLAIENFLLTLSSHDSKFDRAMRGEGELSEDEKKGFLLFFTEREPRMGARGADCFHCHGGALFTDHSFHNNGLDASPADPGRGLVTKRPGDQGKFSTPSLRNIGLTAPYMHDGRFASLDEVIEHYSTGVKRSETLDPNLAKHPAGGLGFTAEEKRALIAFLNSLTDEKFRGPRIGNQQAAAKP